MTGVRVSVEVRGLDGEMWTIVDVDRDSLYVKLHRESTAVEEGFGKDAGVPWVDFVGHVGAPVADYVLRILGLQAEIEEATAMTGGHP